MMITNMNYITIKDNHNYKDNDKKSYNLLLLSRLFGLGLLLLAIYISLSSSSSIKLLKLKLNKTFYIKSCDALGIPSSWKPYNDDNNARLPIYRYVITITITITTIMITLPLLI